MIEHARENLADVRRPGRAASSPTCSSSSSTSRSTRSSPTRPSTGSSTTSGCSRRLFAALRPGGAIEAQCGGKGNVAEWQRALESLQGDERFAAYLGGMPAAWNFASVGDTRDRLERAGFEVAPPASGWSARTVEPPDPRAFAPRGRPLPSTSALLPEELHEEFIDAVLGSMARPLVLEYVRLNISASEARLMTAGSSCCPGDGIGPEIVAAATPGARRRRRVRLRGAPGRRRLDRRPRHRAHRRGARGLPRRRRGPARAPSAARSGTRPTPTRRAPSRACSACARGSACSRTCAR